MNAVTPSTRDLSRKHTRQLIAAQERERDRLARELHDDICQRLALASIEMVRLRAALPSSEIGAQQLAAALGRDLAEIGRDVQALSRRLHAPALGVSGLPGAAEQLCRQLAVRHGLTVTFAASGVPSELDCDTSLNLFRILQEALANGIKHSGSRSVSVRLIGDANALTLTINDAGRGFDIGRVSSGLGLMSMSERATSVGGDLSFESGPGGTCVTATVPLRSR